MRSSLVPHGRQVAYLRHRKQAFILGILVGYSVQQVNIFNRGQAIDLEVLEPPQMQTFAHHGMNSAEKLHFLVAAVGMLVSEVLNAAHARLAICAGNGHNHSM